MTDYKPMLSNVSLVCVESRYPALALYAIERCRAAATFKECLLLSPVQYDVPDYIDIDKAFYQDFIDSLPPSNDLSRDFLLHRFELYHPQRFFHPLL